MPAHLEAWWQEHPERWSRRHRYYHRFPADGSFGKQIDWFRRQFLKLADKASSPKERGEFLKLAFTATLKGGDAGNSDQTLAQYCEHLKRMLAEQQARAAERTNNKV